MKELVWKIGGDAGMGIMASGRTMTKVFSRKGYYVIGYPEYPSLVRGGENTFQIRISTKPINSPVKKIDLLVCLDRKTFDFNKNYLNENAVIIYDKDTMEINEKETNAKLIHVPLSKIAQKNGHILMRNTVAIGASLALMNYDFEILKDVLKETFAGKKEEVIKGNINAAKEGYDSINEKVFELDKPEDNEHYIITGNEAFGLGAVAGGMKFYSAYPMTPASTILHYLAKKERDFDIIVKQAEDEIAAINMAIGANFAGVRAATGTSGGGFALMVEALGMAGIAETPLVIFEVQRTGPSTGMPTWTGQGDLKFVLSASQGDFPRVILAPGDMEEAFYLTAEAFNIAEKYQLPVFVMSDKYLAETQFTTKRFDPNKIKIDRGKLILKDMEPLPPLKRFERYKITEDGISPFPVPGVRGGEHVSSSYEHDEHGFSTENFIRRKAQVDKRARKLQTFIKEMPMPVFYDNGSDITLITWGSQKGIVLDAINMMDKKPNLLHFNIVFPLNKEKLKEMFKGFKHTVIIENNSTGHFAGILKEYADIDVDVKVLKYDGRQFFPEEIVEVIKRLKNNNFEEKEIRLVDDEKYDYLQAKKVIE